MISDISVLKTRLFYFASLVSLLGHIIDVSLLDNDHAEYFINLLTISVIVLLVLLVKNKVVTSDLGNAVIIYTIFINLIISVSFKASWGRIDGVFLQTCLVYGILMLYAGFTLSRFHIFLIGVSFIIFYVIIAFVSKGYLLIHNMPLILILLGTYLFGVNVIVTVLDNYNKRQLELINDLTKSNTLLKEKGEELNKLNKTKDKILSIIGHDLKTPASGIMGFSDLIGRQADKLGSDTLNEYSKLIYQSANRLNIFLSQILDWARIQSGKREVNLQKFNANEVITDAIALMHGTIYLKKIGIDTSCQVAVVIKADKQMFSTIVRNLLTNALKYSPKEGQVYIESKIEEDHYTFCIIDSGKGVDKAVADKLFTSDMIESKPGTENEKGTGLGMTICHEYIKLHRGSIWVENTKNKGAAFYFTIPLNL